MFQVDIKLSHVSLCASLDSVLLWWHTTLLKGETLLLADQKALPRLNRGTAAHPVTARPCICGMHGKSLKPMICNGKMFVCTPRAFTTADGAAGFHDEG